MSLVNFCSEKHALYQNKERIQYARVSRVYQVYLSKKYYRINDNKPLFFQIPYGHIDY